MNHILINDQGTTVDLRMVNDRVLCIYKYKMARNIDAAPRKRVYFMQYTRDMTSAVRFWRKFYGFRKLVSY